MAETLKQHGEQVRQDILDAIISYIDEHGYPPSNREIGEMVGLKSTSSVYSHLLKMHDLGILESDAEFGSPRCIRVPGYKFVKEGATDGKEK